MANEDELKEAQSWWKNNKDKVPPVVGDEVGKKITAVVGKKDRKTKIEALGDEDRAGYANHKPSGNREALTPWGNQSGVKDIIRQRPTEDDAMGE